MALQSSGQIKLSELATEFGGSAPHSMSEYYAGGTNVPSGTGSIPTSGEIQLAADFYGTSNYLASGTITVGYATVKATNDESGYSNGSNTNDNGNRAFGSISSNAISGTSTIITGLFESPQIVQRFRIGFSVAYTNWTKLTLNGSVVLLKSQAINNGTYYHWNGNTTTPTSFILE